MKQIVGVKNRFTVSHSHAYFYPALNFQQQQLLWKQTRFCNQFNYRLIELQCVEHIHKWDVTKSHRMKGQILRRINLFYRILIPGFNLNKLFRFLLLSQSVCYIAKKCIYYEMAKLDGKNGKKYALMKKKKVW